VRIREKKDIIIVVAMPQETQGLIEAQGYTVLYSGLGKINAAYTLMNELRRRALAGETCQAILNFGTAGSASFPTHALVEITKFIQRDMDVSPLGFAKGETPFDHFPTTLDVPKRIAELPSGSCGTGDSFEVAHPGTEFMSVDEDQQVSLFDDEFKDEFDETVSAPKKAKSLLLPYYDVVDMEAYALARICEHERLPFCSVKYITDGADASANNKWVENLPKAAAAFSEILPQILAAIL